MKQKTILVGLFTVLVIGIVAILSFVSRKPGHGSPKPVGDLGTPEPKAVEKDRPRLSVGLDVNSGASALVQGFPFILTVTLRNLSAEEAVQVKNRIDHYTKNVPDEEKAKASEVLSTGKPRWKGFRAGRSTWPIRIKT